MIIKKLTLTNYRNIASESIEFSDKSNVLLGNNGQGKTNIVEAIAYLSLLKSFRNAENKSLIKEGCEFATIEMVNENNKRFKCVLTNEKRQCYINDNKLKKLSDFVGNINVVVFSPEQVSLFKDSPKDRRDFLDDEIIKLSPAYFVYVNDYKDLKKERNELLKKNSIDKTLLETYTSQLAKLSYQIVKRRNEFIEKLKEELNKHYQNLANSKSILSIEYQSDFLNKTEKEILDEYHKAEKEDILKQQTLLGPHKDDLILYLDHKPISEFGSQGQNRLAVVSLKLATLKVIKELSNEDAIVILDDVLSELDEIRQNNLINQLKINNQLFITSANEVINKENINCYYVENGNVRRA